MTHYTSRSGTVYPDGVFPAFFTETVSGTFKGALRGRSSPILSESLTLYWINHSERSFRMITNHTIFLNRHSLLNRIRHQLSIHAALNIAIQKFSRRYPEWNAALFDDYFISQRIAPLVMSGTECSQMLASGVAVEWAMQLFLTDSHRHALEQELTPIAISFLSLLEDELHRNTAVSVN
jgi:hypothetical protein